MCSFKHKNKSRFLAAVLEPSHTADYRQARPLRLPQAASVPATVAFSPGLRAAFFPFNRSCLSLRTNGTFLITWWLLIMTPKSHHTRRLAGLAQATLRGGTRAHWTRRR